MLQRLSGVAPTEGTLSDALRVLDSNEDGLIDFSEFTVWYGRGEHLVNAELDKHLARINVKPDGFVTKVNVRATHPTALPPPLLVAEAGGRCPAAVAQC